MHYSRMFMNRLGGFLVKSIGFWLWGLEDYGALVHYRFPVEYHLLLGRKQQHNITYDEALLQQILKKKQY